METRPLGRSPLAASRVGLGCNNFGMKLGIEETRRVIDAALDAGVTFLDTADMYGGTKSEQFIGAALAGRRTRAVLATKFGGLAMAGKTGERWGTRDYVRKSVEASLARLRTDVIDLYQMHFPDPQTPLEETIGALTELVSEGKVRAIGCSNFTGAMIDPRFATAQNEWSLLVRKTEVDVIPACEKHGVSQLPYFPLASGMLSGKYRRGEPLPAGSRLASSDYFKAVRSEENFEKIEKLRAFAAQRGRSLLELAISWLASQPSVGSVIAGATSPEQVRANAAAASWQLTPAELTEIDALAPR